MDQVGAWLLYGTFTSTSYGSYQAEDLKCPSDFYLPLRQSDVNTLVDSVRDNQPGADILAISKQSAPPQNIRLWNNSDTFSRVIDSCSRDDEV